MPFSSTTITTDPYTPNGVTSIFPFFFLALTRDEVQVVLTDADGVETLLTEGFDIVGIGEPTGGYVQFTVAPDYAGQSLIIRARPSFAQETVFSNQGPYNPAEIEKALDRLAQKAIYLRDLISSGIVVDPGSGIATVTWASVQGKPTTFAPSAHAHAAADVTSGIFDAARIPSLDASKIGAGTLAAAHIPGLDASKITTGTIDQARLPVQSGGLVATDIASLSAPQQALIVEGTLVTTADGSQWRYTGTGSKVLEASYVELSTATDWAALTSVPANISAFAALTGAANKIAHFTGAGTLTVVDFTATGRALVALASQNAAIAYTSPLTTKGDLYGYAAAPTRLPVGTNGQVLTADSAQSLGVKWATPAVGGGSGNEVNFVTAFSGNPDGATNNDAAFTAAEASTYERVYLPEGRYVTTKTRSQLTKRYEGPGVVVSGGVPLHNLRRYSTRVAWTYGTDGEYGEYKTAPFSDQVQFDVVGGRNQLGAYQYYDAPSTPSWVVYNTAGDAGHSGTTAHLSASASAGATSVTLNSVAGLSPGDVIGIHANEIGTAELPTDTVTITTIVGNVVSFTPALSASYTVSGTDYVPTYLSGYASSPQVTRGKRTMNQRELVIFNHSAAGDGYVYGARITLGYTPLAGQTDFFDTSTGGYIGGDITFSQAGIYGTGWEMSYIDNGNDVAMLGFVNSYSRTNDTGARRVVWGHDFVKTSGSKPLDFVWAFQGLARAGLDLVGANLSADGERAIQLKIGQRIYFDGSTSNTPATRARGYWGDVLGDTYITAMNDGVDGLDVWVGGSRAARFRTSSVNFPVQVNASNHINVAAPYTIGVGTGGALSLSGIGGGTYFTFDGATVRLWKNGVLAQSW